MTDLTIADFSNLIGHSFPVTTTVGEIRLVLTEAAPQRGGRPGGREPFTLTFRGPKSPQLNQAMYDFQHPAHGKLPIFIVPVGVDAEGTLYEAVFS